MDRDQIAAELNKPLLKSHVQPAQKFGPKGDYLHGWFVIEEANRIFGWDGWSYQIVALDVVFEGPREIGQAKKPGFGVTYTCRVRLGVGGIAREDVGAGHGYDVDCGLAHESAIKEAVTDALKRALRTFGNPFGLALYDKSRANVEDDTKPNADEVKRRAAALAQARADEKAANQPMTPKQKAINWLCGAVNLAGLDLRMENIAKNYPDTANDPDVEDTYKRLRARFVDIAGPLPDGAPFGLPNPVA